MTSTKQLICLNCKHYDPSGSLDHDGWVCKAFPEGIPEEITLGDNPHKKELPGQVPGYVFKFMFDE